MAFLRSVVFFIGYTLITISYGTGALFSWLLPPLLRHKIISSWTVVVIGWLRFCCGVRYQVNGVENITGVARPFVVLSKHQSTWETLYLQTLFWPSATVLKKELLKIPFFGWGLRALDPIAIDRSNPRDALRQVKAESIECMQRGLNIILFPEGTRMAPGQRGVYARSGADIAKSTNVAIVPIAIHNAALCWPAKQFTKYPGLITVSVGPVISTQDRSSKEIMAEVEAWIEGEMLRLAD